MNFVSNIFSWDATKQLVKFAFKNNARSVVKMRAYTAIVLRIKNN